MKRHSSVRIALGLMGCTLLLLGNRATAVAAPKDESDKPVPSEDWHATVVKKSKKASKAHVAEQAHRNTVRGEDHARDDRKRDHFNSHGERDELIGAGVSAAVTALGELHKPKQQAIYNGVPVATEKPAKPMHRAVVHHGAELDSWSKIDPLRKDDSFSPPQDGFETIALTGLASKGLITEQPGSMIHVSDHPSTGRTREKPPSMDPSPADKASSQGRKTRTPDEQAILDRKYTAASKRLDEARDEYARSLRVYDPEIATMEDSLAGWNEEDPGTGEDDGPAEAQKEQLYEGYLHRMAESEKAWLNTPRGKVVADIYRDAKEEIRRLNDEDGLTQPKPGEPDPADREEIH